jgi:hypothetical protein
MARPTNVVGESINHMDTTRYTDGYMGGMEAPLRLEEDTPYSPCICFGCGIERFYHQRYYQTSSAALETDTYPWADIIAAHSKWIHRREIWLL